MIALIRHGQTDWNLQGRMQGSSDIPLNDTGRQQAHDAVAVVRAMAIAWDVVVSSPLSRARETAEILAVGLGVPLGPSYHDFVERDFGALEGMPEADVDALWPERDEPSAETLDSVVGRGLRGLLEVEHDYPGKQVIVVCHGTIIHYTLNAIAGTDVGRINNAAVSTIEPVEGGWRVTMVNGAPFPG